MSADHPQSPSSSAKFERPSPQPAFVCWHLQFIYSFCRSCCFSCCLCLCLCLCLHPIYFAPASTAANIAYTLCVRSVYSVYATWSLPFSADCREPENGSIGRSNTSAASEEPHRIKSVVRSFGGVISRGSH